MDRDDIMEVLLRGRRTVYWSRPTPRPMPRSGEEYAQQCGSIRSAARSLPFENAEMASLMLGVAAGGVEAPVLSGPAAPVEDAAAPAVGSLADEGGLPGSSTPGFACSSGVRPRGPCRCDGRLLSTRDMRDVHTREGGEI